MPSPKAVAIAIAFSLVALCALAPRTSALNLPFTGTLRFDLAVDRAAVPFEIPGAGVAVVNGSGAGGHLSSLSLPGSTFSAAAVVLPVTDIIGAFPLGGFQFTVHNGAGTAFGNGIPLAGAAKMCVFGSCSAAVANVTVPLSVVGGGTAIATGMINQTVIGAPWTLGTATVGAITRMGFAHGPASGTSSTAAASGTVQLVTPIFVSTNLGNNPTFASFATLTLHFVPEPGTLILLGGGVVALVALGRRTQS